MGGDDLPANMDAALRLSQAVASRLCHDLVSPVGAVVNGVDLMREMGPLGGPEEIAMIGASAARAGELLEFHRLAFGAGSADGAPVARTVLAGMAESVIASKRIALALSPATGPALTRPEARLAALMLLAGRGLLGLRGRIELVLGPEAAWPMRLSAGGEGVATASDARARLARSAETPESRDVEFALLAPAAGQAGAGIAVEDGADGPVLTATPL